jgi:hypothetical protein
MELVDDNDEYELVMHDDDDDELDAVEVIRLYQLVLIDEMHKIEFEDADENELAFVFLNNVHMNDVDDEGDDIDYADDEDDEIDEI